MITAKICHFDPWNDQWNRKMVKT